MGLFDGKVIDLGNKLANNLDNRVGEMIEQLKVEDNPGRSLSIKICIFMYSDLADVIRKTVNE